MEWINHLLGRWNRTLLLRGVKMSPQTCFLICTLSPPPVWFSTIRRSRVKNKTQRGERQRFTKHNALQNTMLYKSQRFTTPDAIQNKTLYKTQPFTEPDALQNTLYKMQHFVKPDTLQNMTLYKTRFTKNDL